MVVVYSGSERGITLFAHMVMVGTTNIAAADIGRDRIPVLWFPVYATIQVFLPASGHSRMSTLETNNQ